MKPALTFLFPSLLIISISCHHAVVPAPNQPADLNYTTDLAQAQKWFDGQWKLLAASANVTKVPLADVRLVVIGNQLTIVQDGKQTDHVEFMITQTPYDLQLTPTTQPKEDDWYVRNPILRVSTNRLFLDTGQAVDRPAFSFERVN